MGQLGFYRSRRGWRRIKGFRVNSSRLSAHRLRVRFLDFIRLLRKWKCLCNRALNHLTSGRKSSPKSTSRSGSRRGLVSDHHQISGPECKLRSYGRSNSFYAEAIADCLEFIKRSAVTVEDEDGRVNER